jgi:hypothetical protein
MLASSHRATIEVASRQSIEPRCTHRAFSIEHRGRGSEHLVAVWLVYLYSTVFAASAPTN